MALRIPRAAARLGVCSLAIGARRGRDQMVAALKQVAASVILVVLGAGLTAAQSDADRRRAKDAVVMIQTKLPDGPQMGAGIIVAVTPREVYVATANHLV